METYLISAEGPFVESCCESVKTNEPKEAIEKWFDFGRKYPMCANVQCATKEDAKKILLYVKEHEEDVKELYDKGCPYKWEWFLNGVEKGIRTECADFQWEWDSISPFSMG